MNPVELCTVAPWHFSPGDMSTATVTAQHLVLHGIPVLEPHAPSGLRPAVIGGGNLLAEKSESHWSALLDRFHLPGRHCLNAVSIQGRPELSHLRDYIYLSARDRTSADLIEQATGRTCDLVPCPAVLQESVDRDTLSHLPRWATVADHLDPSPAVIHCCPELRRLQTLVGPKIGIHPRPWYDWQEPGHWRIQQCPLTHSPAVLSAVVRSAAVVFTRSLHLAIWSIGAGVPFLVPRCYPQDHQADKIVRYLERCGLADLVVPIEQLPWSVAAARVFKNAKHRLPCVRITERSAAWSHLSELVASLSSSGGRT